MVIKLNVNFLRTYVHWIASFAVFTYWMQLGISMGWFGPNNIKLEAENSDIKVNKGDMNWIASIHFFVGIPGAFVGALGVEFVGSRIMTLVGLMFMAINWVCMICANNVIWIYVSRGLIGVVLGCSYSVPLYLGEILDPKIRGTVMVIFSSGHPFGVVVGTIAEAYLPRMVSSAIYLAPCLVALLLFVWLHDTPYYLIAEGKHERARESVCFYHSSSDVEYELAEIKSFVESHAIKGFRERIQDFKSPVVRKSMFLMIILTVLPPLSGTVTILSFMQSILLKGKFNLIGLNNFAIYANVISMVSLLLTFKSIDVFGRKISLIISGIGTAASMAGLAINFYLIDDGFNSIALQWLQIICIICYLVSCAVGFTPVPSAVLSEIFTDNLKSTASLMVSLSNSLAAFLVSHSFESLVGLIGKIPVFGIHALFSLMAVPCALLLLPETKGKSFQEIQDSLEKK